MFRRLFGRRCAFSQIEMPAHILPAVLHLHRHAAIHRAIDDSVIADGPVAVQTNAREMDRHCVSRRSSLDVERASLRISAEHAAYTFFLLAARIHGSGMNGVARRN